MLLTEQNMNDARDILNGDSTHNGRSGTEGFYEYLADKGDPYGRLGLGVTNNDTWQGQTANGFAESGAEDNNVDMSHGSDAHNDLNEVLARRHLEQFVANEGTPPTHQQIKDYHNEEYDNKGLDNDDWFPNRMLENSNDPAGLWNDWMSNDNGLDILEDAGDVLGAGGRLLFGPQMAGEALANGGLDPADMEFARNLLEALAGMDDDAKEDLARDLLGDDLYDLPADYGWAFDNPGAIFNELLPQWMKDLFNDWGNAKGEGSPLVLDLDGSGIDLVSVLGTDAVYWDIDEDGFAEKSGWISGNDGLLAIDLNSDGVINNHGELFGTGTTDGFTILSAYDSNADNIIDANDTQFGDLLVWVDTNQNGYSESDELYSLTDLSITSININASLVDYYIADNHITHESTFTINGQTQAIVDAWFAYDNVNSHYQESYTLDIRTLFLPTLRGFGDVKDLHISMSMDETLILMVQEIATAATTTLFDPAFDLSGKFEDILFRWAGVETVDPNGRGIYVNGQELAFLEKFFGESYLQQSTFEDPGHAPAETLNTLYDQLSKTLLNNMLVQGAASVFYENNAHYNAVTGSIENSNIDFVNIIEAGQASINSSNENDAYVVSTQAGNVSLYEQGGLDEIWLSGVDSEDVRLENVSNSHLKIHTGTQTITVNNHFGSFYQSGLDGYRIEKLVLDDGTTVDLLNDLTFSGSSGNDNIVGLLQSDTLDGKGGNDQLDASAGNDTLIGGTGDDWLYGGVGDDQYIWSVGDGNDIIQDSGGVDYIVLHGVLAGEVTTSQYSSHDLKIHIGTETLTVQSQFSSDVYNSSTYDFYQIEKIILDDGTEIVLANNTSYTEDPSAPDVVEGTATSDYLYGIASISDVLIGNEGDDYLYGDTGDDTYVYNLGDGSDTITDYGGLDTLEFGSGITVDDVRLWKDNNHLELYIGADKIKLDNQFHSSYGYEIETAMFADGTTLDLLNNLTFTGTTGSDYVYGQTVDSDTLIGGEGDDYLYGDTGDDVYVYNLGDGNDTITDYAGFDTISFGVGITVDHIRFWKNNNHLELYIGSDKIKLDNQFHSSYGYEIETATFSDGTTLGLLNNLTFTGTTGSDYVYGQTVDNDTLVGGEGDDYLYGDTGDDIYVYNLGDGSDTITDYGGIDTIEFGAGITVDDIRLWRDNNHLELYIGADKIKLDHQLHSSYGYEIETATFADGSTLDLLNNLTFTGTTGSDYVYGQSNINDTLVGGEGNDYLYGDTGDDVYVYNLGDGSDTITDYGGVDTLMFGAGITIGDISLLSDGNDLEIHIGSEIIELKSQLHSSYGYEIETAVFADGSILDLVNNLTFTGTAASESMNGTAGNDILYGGEGSDYLYAGSGDDVLYGGAGVDMLYGQAGADTFAFESSSAFSASDNIQDFNLAEGDKLDVSDLLSGYDPLTDAISDFVQITESGSNSYLSVDADGGADNFVQVAYLYNATGLTDEEALETSGNLIAA